MKYSFAFGAAAWLLAISSPATGAPLSRVGDFPAVIEFSSLDGTNGFRLDGINAGDWTGQSVGNAGDINGDGISDLIVGAPGASPTGTRSGSTYLVFGRSSGFPATISLSSLDGSTGFRLDGVAADDQSGYSVASAGDVNGDGIRDVIIGARVNSPSGPSYVVFGRTSGFPATMNLSSLNGTNGFRLKLAAAGDLDWGWHVSRAGDVNGDDVADIIIGDPFADPNGKELAGSSFVIFGRTTGFPATINLDSLDGTDGFRMDGEKRGDQSGSSVAGAGDINADGMADVIIGAPQADRHQADLSGSSYVVFGKKAQFPAKIELSSLDGITGFRMDGGQSNRRSGTSVARAGDVNDDGIADVVIGAPGAGYWSGASFVVFGKASAFRPKLLLSHLNGKNGFRIRGVRRTASGTDVSSAGDINDDGIGDLIIGAPWANPNENNSGSTYVVYGQKTAFPSNIDLCCLNGAGFRLDGVKRNDISGHTVANAGDVNQDGVTDIVIGAPLADPNGKMEAGSTYVVFGKP